MLFGCEYNGASGDQPGKVKMAIVSRQDECCHLCGQEKWGLQLTPFSLLRAYATCLPIPCHV